MPASAAAALRVQVRIEDAAMRLTLKADIVQAHSEEKFGELDAFYAMCQQSFLLSITPV